MLRFRDEWSCPQKTGQQLALGPNDRRLSALHIRRACEDSFRRLKNDHIDLYQMHHVNRFTPFEEIWQAMGHCKVNDREAKVRRQPHPTVHARAIFAHRAIAPVRSSR